MNKYTDQWGRFHDKPTDGISPSSNNGWIYTAYAKKVGISIDVPKLRECAKLCKTENGSFNRNPEKTTPPISRDEILGLVSLDLANKSQDWNFSPFPLPKFSLTKLLSQLWKLRPSFMPDYLNCGKKLVWQHRNYFWQNSLDQLYRFAFSVPLQDRHFILKYWDKFQWYNPVHIFYAAVAKVDSMLPKKSGIKWLKYGGEGNMKAMCSEFPVDHPIRLKLGL